MEIKKGISQMAEYPNVEINYVVPRSGNMHYVLKDGILDNGVIIATLDPRHAIDENNPCQNIGVFSAVGDILVDFNKKDIKRITDKLLLVVNSIPTTNLIASVNDATAESNRELIIQKMMEEMGPTGEIIFDDPYSEANVYSTDSYNNKLGLDCSFIGKNNKGLYFHTNDIDSSSKFVKVDEFSQDSLLSDELDEFNDDNKLNLNINPTILGGFQLPQNSNHDLERTVDLEELESVSNLSKKTLEGDTSNDINNITVEPSIVVESDSMDKDQDETLDVKENQLESEKTKFDEIYEKPEISISSTEETELSKQVLTSSQQVGEKEGKVDSKVEVNLEEKEELNDYDIKYDNNIDEEESDSNINEKDLEDNYDTFDEEGLDDSYDDLDEDELDDGYDNSYEEESDDSYDDFEEDQDDEEEKFIKMEKPRKSIKKKNTILNDIESENQVLDNAIDLINKMIEEADRLNRKIRKLERKLDQKEMIIEEQLKQMNKQEEKKAELNTLLNRANRLLDNIE